MNWKTLQYNVTVTIDAPQLHTFTWYWKEKGKLKSMEITVLLEEYMKYKYSDEFLDNIVRVIETELYKS